MLKQLRQLAAQPVAEGGFPLLLFESVDPDGVSGGESGSWSSAVGSRAGQVLERIGAADLQPATVHLREVTRGMEDLIEASELLDERDVVLWILACDAVSVGDDGVALCTWHAISSRRYLTVGSALI